jgi:hypothetical protein
VTAGAGMSGSWMGKKRAEPSSPVLTPLFPIPLASLVV